MRINKNFYLLVELLKLSDLEVYNHCRRVCYYSKLIGRHLNLSDLDMKRLILSSLLHDIGKIAIPSEIIKKPSLLTEQEFEVIKFHSISSEAISKIVLPEDIPLIIRHHHERYDGNGYPDKLKGFEIPFLARILSVIDSYEAMTNQRPYNKPKNDYEAICELEDNSSTQFDPVYAKAMVKILRSTGKISI